MKPRYIICKPNLERLTIDLEENVIHVAVGAFIL